MEKAGPVIGLPFSIETYAFLFEAIFLSLYLFARDRLSPWLHLATLLPVCLGALASAWIGGPLPPHRAWHALHDDPSPSPVGERLRRQLKSTSKASRRRLGARTVSIFSRPLRRLRRRAIAASGPAERASAEKPLWQLIVLLYVALAAIVALVITIVFVAAHLAAGHAY
jgi:bd-type cytochrome oxidase subunit I